MKAELVLIGSELVLGRVPETNSLFLTRELAALGISVGRRTVVGDDEGEIAAVLKEALGRSPLVITTGGLGATVDDLTKRAVARVTRQRLVLHRPFLEKLRQRFAGRSGRTGRRPGRLPRRYIEQAMIPSRAQVLENPIGSAPGLSLGFGKGHLIVLPGVPREMRGIFSASVRDLLKARVGAAPPLVLQVIRTFGLTEAQVNEAIRGLAKTWPGKHLGTTVGPDGVDVYAAVPLKAGAAAERRLRNFKKILRKKLGEAVYSEAGQDMEEVVGQALRAGGLRLAVAESCTGGLIAHRLTNLPGSSDYFDRGVICYSNQSKADLLGVPKDLLLQFGAVSVQAAAAMAEGVRKISGAHLGLSTTGIAGPAGATPQKPVGLVHMALATDRGTFCQEHRFSGERAELKHRFSQAALDMVRRHLIRKKDAASQFYRHSLPR